MVKEKIAKAIAPTIRAVVLAPLRCLANNSSSVNDIVSVVHLGEYDLILQESTPLWVAYQRCDKEQV